MYKKNTYELQNIKNKNLLFHKRQIQDQLNPLLNKSHC